MVVTTRTLVERSDGMTGFGLKIKQLREEHGMTQTRLAKVLGVTKGTVSVWERGLRMPELETLERVAKRFEISVGYLLEGADTEVEADVEAGETDTAEEKVDVARVKALTEKLLRLSADSLDIVEGTIETAYKRDREKGRLGADEGLEVVIR